MRKLLAYALVTFLLVLTGALVTAQLDLSTFTPNTPIESAEVNHDFQVLAAAIEAIQDLPTVRSLHTLAGELTLVAGNNVTRDVEGD